MLFLLQPLSKGHWKKSRHLTTNEIGHQRRHPVVLIVSPAVFNGNVLSFYVAGLIQAPAECDQDTSILSGRPTIKEPDYRRRRLLRSRGQRQRNGRSAHNTEKIPPPHTSTQPLDRHRISSSAYFDRGGSDTSASLAQPGNKLLPPEFADNRSVHHTVHLRPLANGIEQRPVALLDDVSLREWRARFLAEGAHHSVITVVAKQHHTDGCRERCAAGFTKRSRHLGAALRFEVGEGAARKAGEVGQCATNIVAVTLKASENVTEDQIVVSAGHAIGLARRDDRASQRAQVAGLFGGEVGVWHLVALSRTDRRGAA